MATAAALLAVAVASLAASVGALSANAALTLVGGGGGGGGGSSFSSPVAPSLGSSSPYTTSLLFDDLVQPLCTQSSIDDACYGCFTRYSRMRQVPAAYEELQKCSREYLNGTSYAQCHAAIEDAKVIEGEQSSVFCDFEKCVRKRDMLQVVDACTKQRDNSKSEVDNYLQTTSCIIEEMKRRKVLSGPRYPGGSSIQMAYALYVTEAGELRVMSAFPGVNSQYTCEASQSSFGPFAAAAGGTAGQ